MTQPASVMPYINGKSFRCECGCNVFHSPAASRPYVYECNGCGQWYEGEPASPLPSPPEPQ